MSSITRLLPGSFSRCDSTIFDFKCTNQWTNREAASTAVVKGGQYACWRGLRGFSSTITAVITCKSSSRACHLGCHVSSSLWGDDLDSMTTLCAIIFMYWWWWSNLKLVSSSTVFLLFVFIFLGVMRRWGTDFMESGIKRTNVFRWSWRLVKQRRYQHS